MLGFLPGFPYLGTVDPAIAAPRRATPRLTVARGFGRDCRCSDRHLSGGNAGRLAGDRPDAGQTVRPVAIGRRFFLGRAMPSSSTRSDERGIRARAPTRAADDRPGSRALGSCRHEACRRRDRWIPGRIGSRTGSSGTTRTRRRSRSRSSVPNWNSTTSGRGRRRGALRSRRRRSTAGAATPRSSCPQGPGCVSADGRAERAAYLAVAGGFAVPRGARQPLDPPRRAESAASPAARWQPAIVCRSAAAATRRPGRTLCRSRLARWRGGPIRVRVLPGPQADRFPADALEVLQSSPYTIANESDRMGFRLDGPASHTHAPARTSSRMRRRSACCRCRHPASRFC